MISLICLLTFDSVDHKDTLVHRFVKYKIKFGSIHHLQKFSDIKSRPYPLNITFVATFVLIM